MGVAQDWLDGKPLEAVSYEMLRQDLDRQGFPDIGPIDVTAYGDTERKWLVPARDSMGTISNYTYQVSNTAGMTSNTVYPWINVGPYDLTAIPQPSRQPEAVFLYTPPKLTPEEELIRWLRKRVAEICWTP